LRVAGGIVVKKKTKETKGSIKRRSTGNGTKAAKDSAVDKTGPVDLAKVRENIDRLVGHSAERMAKKAIEVAEQGQVAPMKYLFEAVGLYPAAKETKGAEDSLPYGLLKRIGMAKEAAIQDDNPRGQGSAEKSEL
jgi:hypothetical protein